MRPGDRVTLAAHAHYREGRGLPGTVVQVWGHGRWATVDVDHHGEITCRVSELEPAETPQARRPQGAGRHICCGNDRVVSTHVPSWVPPVVDGPTGPGMG